MESGELKKLWRGEGNVVKVVLFERSDGVEHKVFFVVSRYRKKGDLEKVLEQQRLAEQFKLSKYQQSLFDACFRKW